MKCSHCGFTQGLFPYARDKNKNGTVNVYYYCRKCNAERFRKYRSSKKGSVSTLNSVLKYQKTHPERVKAWAKCRKLPKKPCEVCGEERTDKHHPDINKPTEVVYLCRVHHNEADRKLREQRLLKK